VRRVRAAAATDRLPNDDGHRAEPSVAPAAAGSAAATSSCDMREERGTCLEFAEPKDKDAKNCESDLAKGKYARTPCPSEGVIGVCVLHDGDRRRYYAGKARDGFDGTLQGAQADCEGMNAQYATLGKKQTFTPAAR
jgi:hypothetical protein